MARKTPVLIWNYQSYGFQWAVSKKLGSFSFRFPKTGGTPSAVVFEVINKRFFATDRKMNNLVNWRDGFFDFDPYTKIFQKFGEKTFNFQIWRQKSKNFFWENKAILWFGTSLIVMIRSKSRSIAQFKKIKSRFSNFDFPNNVITVSACSKKFLNTGRNRKIRPDYSLDYSFIYPLQKTVCR